MWNLKVTTKKQTKNKTNKKLQKKKKLIEKGQTFVY